MDSAQNWQGLPLGTISSGKNKISMVDRPIFDLSSYIHQKLYIFQSFSAVLVQNLRVSQDCFIKMLKNYCLKTKTNKEKRKKRYTAFQR